MVTPKNLYNMAEDLVGIAGKKDATRYFTDPGDEPFPPQQDPELQKAQMEAQLKHQEMQQKAQIEQLQAQADIATNDRKVEADLALAERKFQFDAQLKQQEFELERELKMLELQAKQQQYQMDMQRQTTAHEIDIEKAELGLQTQAEKAHIDNSMKVEDHKRKTKEAASKTESAKGPVSSGLKKLMDAQSKQAEQIAALTEAVESDREIEIVRDPKTNRAKGAVSRRKKPSK
jgi:hypothetical protein